MGLAHQLFSAHTIASASFCVDGSTRTPGSGPHRYCQPSDDAAGVAVAGPGRHTSPTTFIDNKEFAMHKTIEQPSEMHNRPRGRARRAVAIAASLAVMGIVTSCGGGGHGHENSAVPNNARTISVTADGFKFSPDRMTAQVGEALSIELTSVDIAHDLNVDAFDGHVYAEAGQTAEGGFTATSAGEFDFYCSIPGHREAGMEGTLVVAE